MACIKEFSPLELEAMREARQDLLVIDVREPSEHEQGQIAFVEGTGPRLA